MPALEFNTREELNIVHWTTPPKKHRFYVTTYLSEEERRELIRDCTERGVLLYDYLLRLSAVGDKRITDEDIAEYFGWSVLKATRVRRDLLRTGWLYELRYRMDKNLVGVTYILGKEQVKAHLDRLEAPVTRSLLS